MEERIVIRGGEHQSTYQIGGVIVTWVPGRSGGEQGVEQGARRSDGTQAVDTHVVDVTRPRQVTGTTETTCRLSEANFSLSRFPSFESFRYVDFPDFRAESLFPLTVSP